MISYRIIINRFEFATGDTAYLYISSVNAISFYAGNTILIVTRTT